MNRNFHIAFMLIAARCAFVLPAAYGDQIIMQSIPPNTLRFNQEALNQAIQSNPSAENYRNQGETYQGMGFSKEALFYLDAAVELDPHNVRALILRGQLYFESGFYPEAIKNFDDAIKAEPTNFLPYLLRASSFLKSGDYWRTLDDADKALQLKADPTRVHLLRGAAYDGMRKYKTAIDELTAAIQGNPKLPKAFYWRAEAYRGLEQYQQAVNDYTQALQLEPGYRAALLGRAWSNHKLGKDADALSDCSRAVKFDNNGDLIAINKFAGEKPVVALNEPSAEYNLGKELVGDLNNALTFYDDFLKSKPGDPDAMRDRGAVYMHFGKYPEAINDFNAANKAVPVNPTEFSGIGREADYNAARPFYEQANQELSKGDNQAALNHYRSALKLYPQYAKCWHNMAIACGRLGDYFAAELCCIHAISYRPDDWKLWNTLGVMMHKEFIQDQDDPQKLRSAVDAMNHALDLANAQEAQRSGPRTGGSGAGGDRSGAHLATAADIANMHAELDNLAAYRRAIVPSQLLFDPVGTMID